MEQLYTTYLQLILKGDRLGAAELIFNYVKKNGDIKLVYLEVFQRSLVEVGYLWERNLISIAEEHMATAITQSIMSSLYPLILATEKNGYTMVATCVGGELHELGVRMLADFFEMEGWDVYYLGANTPTQAVLTFLEKKQPDCLAISATLPSHVEGVRGLIRSIRDRFSPHPWIMVGGAPFNHDPYLYLDVGADITAENPAIAVEKLSSFEGQGRRMG